MLLVRHSMLERDQRTTPMPTFSMGICHDHDHGFLERGVRTEMLFLRGGVFSFVPTCAGIWGWDIMCGVSVLRLH